MHIVIKKILDLHRSQLLFLCETKLSSRQATEECTKSNLDNCFVVSKNGMSKGLAIM